MRLFYSYSHRDEKMRDKLETHLSALKQSGVLSEWHDRKILAGDDFDHTISEHLDAADVILFLVSADFLASRYIRDVEVKRALERHRNGHARVIPIILRPVELHGVPFEHLLRLPKDGRPVEAWKTRNEAFADIARGIRAAAEQMEGPMAQPKRRPMQTGSIASVEAEFVEQARLFDTGVAQTIPVGESREVLAMIRRPDSRGLVDVLEPGEDSPFGSATAYSVYQKDVRTTPFTAFFGNSRQSLRVRVELRAPSLEISDSPMTIRLLQTADTGVLSFLVLSKDTGTQTLKVRIICDDEELVSNLLRTRFVHHGGPGPSGAAMAMRLETDEAGKHIIVLAESELLIRFAAKTYQERQAQA